MDSLDARRLRAQPLQGECYDTTSQGADCGGPSCTSAAATVQGSSHREALAVLNEPCADNTDTYAWVSDGAHDKLYLIMDFNPLHEPGQGNQGLRACNGYRYEFHIAKGASLKDEVVYRVEFTNRLTPEAAPSAADPWAAATSCSGSSPAAPRP